MEMYSKRREGEKRCCGEKERKGVTERRRE
jgi:hypothetical protein